MRSDGAARLGQFWPRRGAWPRRFAGPGPRCALGGSARERKQKQAGPDFTVSVGLGQMNSVHTSLSFIFFPEANFDDICLV